MKKEFIPYLPIAEAICQLLYPHAEVVIHDIKTDSIAAIFNNFSKRKVGDESLLEETKNSEEYPDVFSPYFKINWDGKKIRATSATLRNKEGKVIGLLCINLDVSKWEEMHQFISQLIQPISQKQPEILFKDDWREKINVYVSAYLKQEGISLQALTRDAKKELILALHREGAFKAKNAASYIADVLKLSRATVYNYLGKK